MSVEPADLPTDAAVRAIHVGDAQTLKRLLSAHPSLATVRVGRDGCEEGSRTLLHVATAFGQWRAARRLVECGARTTRQRSGS